MMRAFIFILVAVVVFQTQSIAQKKTKEHKINKAIGIAIGGATSTLAEVKQMAINKAKVDALQKAGIEEHINSYTDYFRSETNDKMEELFTSDVLSNIRGSVKEIKVIDFKNEFTPENQIKGTATISCVVVEYIAKRDLEFDVWVEGFKPIYKEGDGLFFGIKPTKDCYMKAFMFTKNDDFVFYPNPVETSKLFSAMQVQAFPYDAGKYELDAGGENRETDRVVLVFMKRNIPYTDKVAYKNITDWIMNIPPDERVIKSFSFDVYKDID